MLIIISGVGNSCPSVPGRNVDKKGGVEGVLSRGHFGSFGSHSFISSQL